MGNWRLGAGRASGDERLTGGLEPSAITALLSFGPKSMDSGIGDLELAAIAAERLPGGLEPGAITAQISFGLDNHLSAIYRWCW